MSHRLIARRIRGMIHGFFKINGGTRSVFDTILKISYRFLYTDSYVSARWFGGMIPGEVVHFLVYFDAILPHKN